MPIGLNMVLGSCNGGSKKIIYQKMANPGLSQMPAQFGWPEVIGRLSL
jgi:hypothetical protein